MSSHEAVEKAKTEWELSKKQEIQALREKIEREAKKNAEKAAKRSGRTPLVSSGRSRKPLVFATIAVIS